MTGCVHIFKIEPLRTVLCGLISLPFILHNGADIHSQIEPQIDGSPTGKRTAASLLFLCFLIVLHHLQRWALSIDFENNLHEPITFLQIQFSMQMYDAFQRKDTPLPSRIVLS